MQGCTSPGTPNAFSRPRVLLPDTSDGDGIDLPRPHIGKQCRQDAKYGMRSRAQNWLPQGRMGPQLVRSRLSGAPRRDENVYVNHAVHYPC